MDVIVGVGVKPLKGDLFTSKAQTLVNTVNCVGVMGKGIALGFRQRFPEMHSEYVRLCELGQVQLGRPYLWAPLLPPWVLNFPTKDHWRENSSLDAIIEGLVYLESSTTRSGGSLRLRSRHSAPGWAASNGVSSVRRCTSTWTDSISLSSCTGRRMRQRIS